jgi:site-specific recombinase XerD
MSEYLENLSGEILFPAVQSNGIMSKTAYTKFWEGVQKQLDAVGLDSKSITAHTFRHTYATKLYKAGVDLKSAQYLLGHAGISVLLNVYTHIDKIQGAQQAMEKLDGYQSKI